MARSVSDCMKIVPLQGQFGAFPGTCEELQSFLTDNQPINTPMGFHYFEDPETDPISFHTQPEKLLMLAILERATRDLESHIERYYRKNAITWFRLGLQGDKYTDDVSFSFLQCVEALDLGLKEIQYLEQKVKDAEEFEETIKGSRIHKIFTGKNPYKFKKERKPYRASTRALATKARMLERQTSPAICGVLGNSRHPL